MLDVDGTSRFVGDVQFVGTDAGTTSALWNESIDALQFTDNSRASFGTAEDLKIYHDGTTNIITSTNNNISLRPKTGENGILIRPDGAVSLYYNDVEKLVTSSAGVTIQGDLHPNGNLNLGDSTSSSDGRLTCGASQDLSIYHNGTDSKITSSSGTLDIESSNDVRIRHESSGEDYATFTENGAAKLFYNGTSRIETLGVGVTVNGSYYGGSATSPFVKLKTTNSYPIYFEGDANRSGNGNHIAVFRGLWNNKAVGAFVVESSTDTTNKDNGSLLLQTAQDGTNGLQTRVFIKSTGEVGINDTTPSYQLDVSGDVRAGNNSSQGLILVSPNGTHYRVSVDNSGNLSASSV